MHKVRISSKYRILFFTCFNTMIITHLILSRKIRLFLQKTLVKGRFLCYYAKAKGENPLCPHGQAVKTSPSHGGI